MLKKFFESDQLWSGTVLRLTLAIMMFPHGAQKLLGWFGGYGFEGTMQFFTENMGIPYIFALAAILTEFFAPIALVLGVATRLAAASIGGTMVVAALMAHIQYGFFMNWSGQQQGEGIEFHILAVGAALASTLIGAGKWGLDHKIAEKL